MSGTSSIKVNLRPPSSSPGAITAAATDDGSRVYQPPSAEWLQGTWHVTHSTLPMWKRKRNVRITYTILPPSSNNDETTKLDDLVSYQTLGSDKVKTVRGVDTDAGDGTLSGVWHWRGKGWLSIASSRWEILGHGRVSDEGKGGDLMTDQWVVTYFEKTLFTPAGLDIYSRFQLPVLDEVVVLIKRELARMDDLSLRKLVGEMFEVKHD